MGNLKVIIQPTFGIGISTRLSEMEVAETLGANLHRLYLEDTGTGAGTNLILNADGDGATDWVVSGATQIGDHWYQTLFGEDWSGYQTPSIINNINGFTNNAQRIESASPSTNLAFRSNTFTLDAGTNDYLLTFRYRSLVQLHIELTTTGLVVWGTRVAGAYIGDVNELISYTFLNLTDTASLFLQFYSDDAEGGSNKYVEIDNITFARIVR